LKEFAAGSRVAVAICDVEVGNSVPAKKAVSEALAISDDKDTRLGAAIVLARLGDIAGSEKAVAGLQKDFPDDLMLNSVFLPVVRAINYTEHNKPDEAINELRSAASLDLSSGPYGAAYFSMYYRGGAYLKAHDGVSAQAEFRKILDHQGLDPTNPFYGLASLNLARASVIQNDIAKARTAYQDFLALWKDADPDIPILKEAKAEYAKLQ